MFNQHNVLYVTLINNLPSPYVAEGHADVL
jgi:hypothetical protein